MKKQLQVIPWFLILIPVFYFAHFWRVYFYIYTFSDLFVAPTCWTLAVSILCFVLLLSQNTTVKKFSVLALYCSIAFFFFGILFSFLQKHIPVLGHYIIAVPLLVVSIIAVAILIWKHPPGFNKLYFYFNSLFLLLFVYEGVAIGIKQYQQVFSSRDIQALTDKYHINPTGVRPDIFFLVFDEYAGVEALKTKWNYDNAGLDSFLVQKGFYYARNSRSNYNVTPFSIGSILNMDFQPDLADRRIETPEFMDAVRTVTHNQVCDILHKENYRIYNYSYFDLDYDKMRITPLDVLRKTGLINYQTLYGRAYYDMGWRFSDDAETLQKKEYHENLKRDSETYNGIMMTSAIKAPTPAFVYAHFFLPHLPAVFDSSGVLGEEKFLKSRLPQAKKYLSQLKYTNEIIKKLVNQLQAEAQRPRIIIIQSDHGYRWYHGEEGRRLSFINLNAIYFPDKKYDKLYDSISSVNTFRVILNTYFGSNVPLLKDTSIYLNF